MEILDLRDSGHYVYYTIKWKIRKTQTILSIKADKMLAWPSPTIAEIWVRNQMRMRGFVLCV